MSSWGSGALHFYARVLLVESSLLSSLADDDDDDVCVVSKLCVELSSID